MANTTALDAWKEITPLARNEFICWVEDAKQQTTRERRIRRTKEELEDGPAPTLLLAGVQAPRPRREVAAAVRWRRMLPPRAKRKFHPYMGAAQPENRRASQAVASDRDVEDGKRGGRHRSAPGKGSQQSSGDPER